MVSVLLGDTIINTDNQVCDFLEMLIDKHIVHALFAYLYSS